MFLAWYVTKTCAKIFCVPQVVTVNSKKVSVIRPHAIMVAHATTTMVVVSTVTVYRVLQAACAMSLNIQMYALELSAYMVADVTMKATVPAIIIIIIVYALRVTMVITVN